MRVPFGWRPDNKLGAGWWTGRDGENEHRKGGWGPLVYDRAAGRFLELPARRKSQGPPLRWRRRALESGR